MKNLFLSRLRRDIMMDDGDAERTGKIHEISGKHTNTTDEFPF